jgi:hypothetical protein
MLAETFKINEVIQKRVSEEIEFELNSIKNIFHENIKEGRKRIHNLFEKTQLAQKQLTEQTNSIEKTFTENLNYVPANEKSKVLTCFQIIKEVYKNRKNNDDYALFQYHIQFLKDLLLK